MPGRSVLTSLFAAAVVLVATTTHADDLTGLKSTTPEQRASYQTGLLTDLLGLAADQAEKVGAVNLEYAKQLDPILKGNQGSYTRYKKATAILAAKDEAMKPLLSETQYEKFLDSKKSVQKSMEAHFADAGQTGS